MLPESLQPRGLLSVDLADVLALRAPGWHYDPHGLLLVRSATGARFSGWRVFLVAALLAAGIYHVVRHVRQA